MARALVPKLALLCLIPALVAQTLPDPSSWFPLRTGSRWVYQHESRSGNRNNPEVSRWTTTETITSLIHVPEGLVAIRRVEVVGSSTGGYLTARDNSPYLLHGNCIYVLAGSWDTVAEKVRPDYLQYLANGTTPPDFCFPLQVGRHWGTIDMPWHVQDLQNGLFHIVNDHFGSGSLLDVQFKNKVGIVSEHYLHRGTYDEYTKTLKFFTPPQSAHN